MEQKTVDLRGLRCPEPLKIIQQALASIKEGVVTALVSGPSNWNIQRYAVKQGMTCEMLKREGFYEMRVTKTLYDRPKVNALMRVWRALTQGGASYESGGEKGEIIIVGTDSMGKVEDIGRVLMKGFFETMKVTKETPHTIFFLNAGVRLTTTDSELVPILKEIEAMGVEIYSCGTCLKHFNLEAELKVGHRGATNHIVEGIKDFRKVVWI